LPWEKDPLRAYKKEENLKKDKKVYKIFIEIPTWLGDAIMTTPAITSLIKKYPYCEITLFGSFVSTRALKEHPNIKTVVIDESKKKGNRFLNLIKIARNFDSFDLAFSFRRTFTSKFMLFFLKSEQKFSYKRLTKTEIHQAIRYNDFVNKSLNTNFETEDLILYQKKHVYKNKTLGLNPGATYGSAKRWYPQEFAKVASVLSKDFDLVIFGGPGETKIAADIANILDKNKITNYTNLAGKTSIEELISKVAGLDLFITNDSGPMHIAAAYKVKTLSIFGPTKFTETNQWKNPKGEIITKNLPCSPCMKRVCPLEHHKCMKDIKAEDILKKLDYNE